MKWHIEKIINFNQNQLWDKGYSHFGFHDYFGKQYILDYENNWVGCYNKNHQLAWTIGPKRVKKSHCHLMVDILKPVYLSGNKKDELLISSSGNKRIYKVKPNKREVQLLIDGHALGMKDIGNCVYDHNDCIWINEITGCRIWNFNQNGEVIQSIGNGKSGFQRKTVSYHETQFNWIYDMKCGPDGNIYVLDSKNYAVRKLELKTQLVHTIIGTGIAGYEGDGSDASLATLGGNSKRQFDGPWSIALDEENNIFIGDTQNHVGRMVLKKNNIISTIAGKKEIIKGKRNPICEINPLNLNLPLICSMDYYNGRLYIPEWEGDLIILKRK